MTSQILKFDSVSLILNKKEILKDISFTINAGGLSAIIGANGAGKSSLFKILLGLYKVNKGSVLLFGKDIFDTRIKERAKIVGYLPQSVRQPSNIKVIDFLKLSKYPNFEIDNGTKLSLEEIISMVKINTKLLDQDISFLSGGEFRKILLAGVLLQDSKIILADEPASYLDPLVESDIFKALKDCVQNLNKTVIIISHRLPSIMQFCDNVLVLKEGQIIKDIKLESLDAKENVNKIYGN